MLEFTFLNKHSQNQFAMLTQTVQVWPPDQFNFSGCSPSPYLTIKVDLKDGHFLFCLVCTLSLALAISSSAEREGCIFPEYKTSVLNVTYVSSKAAMNCSM